jgi:hypothetical protein
MAAVVVSPGSDDLHGHVKFGSGDETALAGKRLALGAHEPVTDAVAGAWI